MPCAEGELCLVQVSSPEGRDGHGRQGTCGGMLHGTCGSVVGDNEMHRICSKCLDKKGKRKNGSPEGPGSGQSTIQVNARKQPEGAKARLARG